MPRANSQPRGVEPIRAIIFDLDGVIIESADIKTRGFEQLFAGYPDKLPEIMDHHKRNSGLSRFVKFRYYYEEVLGKELSADEEKRLGDRFSQIVLKEVIAAPLVAGAEKFLEANHRRYLLFVASGTPEEELRHILRERGLDACFRGIYGTPRTKPAIIRQILEEHHLRREETIFIGDAESDKMAAEETGVCFIARIGNDNSLAGCSLKVRDMTGLEEVIGRIGQRQGNGR